MRWKNQIKYHVWKFIVECERENDEAGDVALRLFIIYYNSKNLYLLKIKFNLQAWKNAFSIFR